MTTRATIWGVAMSALLPAGSIGCAGGGDSAPQTSAEQVYSVGFMVSTRGNLPTCTSSLAGTVAYVASPPSLYACEASRSGSFSWTSIACSSANYGSVAYANLSPPLLLACVNKGWTPVPLPQGEAGPPGPRGPAGPPGEAGAPALISTTQLPSGDAHCPTGGVRIDTTSDGVAKPPVYVCNGGEEGDATASDGGTGASDAADASDVKTLPPGLVAYPTQNATAFCNSMARCCGVDAGAFDMTSCVSDWSVSAWELMLPDNVAVFTAGNLTFNSIRGNACIAALQAWPCDAFGTSENGAIVSACFNVLGGTIPVAGTGCLSSYECANGYCNAAGTCTALVGLGGACQADEQCGQAGTTPTLFCDLYPSDGSSPSTGTCQPLLPSGSASFCGNANVLDDLACTVGVCGDDNVCGDSKTNPASNICPGYVLGGG